MLNSFYIFFFYEFLKPSFTCLYLQNLNYDTKNFGTFRNLKVRNYAYVYTCSVRSWECRVIHRSYTHEHMHPNSNSNNTGHIILVHAYIHIIYCGPFALPLSEGIVLQLFLKTGRHMRVFAVNSRDIWKRIKMAWPPDYTNLTKSNAWQSKLVLLGKALFICFRLTVIIYFESRKFSEL